METNATRLPTYYLSHGGGPWPYMKGELRQPFARLEAALKRLPQELGDKARAILVVSGHSEGKDFAVMASSTPPMVCDFGGFPDYLYQIRYPAPGSPEFAGKVQYFATPGTQDTSPSLDRRLRLCLLLDLVRPETSAIL